MNDLISRQAAIDALEREKSLVERPITETRWFDLGLGKAQDVLSELPSAQPEPCEDAVSRNTIIQKLNTMDRYVSEELTLCDTDKKFPKNEVFIVDDVYEEIVEHLPSVQPEIVRCKDCKHRYIEDMIWHCPFGLMGGENFFCGYGSLEVVERGKRDE